MARALVKQSQTDTSNEQPIPGRVIQVERVATWLLSRTGKELPHPLLDWCESPIERMMVCCLYTLAQMLSETARAGVKLRTQAPVPPYRVDILMEAEDGRRLIIECDGHEWHERTREQAATDRQRDRFLLRCGYLVLRFTGREIWLDPWFCALEVLEFWESIGAHGARKHTNSQRFECEARRDGFHPLT